MEYDELRVIRDKPTRQMVESSNFIENNPGADLREKDIGKILAF
jgi:hypothetical protein